LKIEFVIKFHAMYLGSSIPANVIYCLKPNFFSFEMTGEGGHPGRSTSKRYRRSQSEHLTSDVGGGQWKEAPFHVVWFDLVADNQKLSGRYYEMVLWK